jgi:hypothetical protein
VGAGSLGHSVVLLIQDGGGSEQSTMSETSTAIVHRRPFELATFERRTGRLDVTDIDFDVFRARPLDASTLRCLRYMHDIESHTVCYLRDLLVTRAHRDPEVTAFLTHWNHEEYWHGAAIGRVLAAHDEIAGPARVAAVRRSRRTDGLRPLAFWAASAVGAPVVAVSMAWGAINEMVTQAAYGLLAAKAQHPTLTRLLRGIMKQEGRHIDFYTWQARRRLADGAVARRATRWTLQRWWEPVGAGVVADRETAFLARHLFGDDPGRAAADRVDRRVQRLPGLDGLTLVHDAAVAWPRRAT